MINKDIEDMASAIVRAVRNSDNDAHAEAMVITNLTTLTNHHQAEVERVVEAERERILKVQYAKPVSTNPMYNTGFNDAVARIFTAIRGLTPLTPTKTDKQ